MAIQNRRGDYAAFDPAKMLPGEWAVVTSNDPDGQGGTAVYMCFSAGIVKRITTFNELSAFQNVLNSAVNDTNTHKQDIASINSTLDTLKNRFSALNQNDNYQFKKIENLEEADKDFKRKNVVYEGKFSKIEGILSAMSNTLNNAVADVSDLVQDVSDLKSATKATEDILTGKIDGAYMDKDGNFYLTSNDEVIAGPFSGFSGGGSGGGGGSNNNAQLSMQNASGWITSTVAENASCIIEATWSSLEDEMSTGAGSMTLTVNGERKLVRAVEQGKITVDVGKYLKIGNNRLRLSIADAYGNTRTINYTVSVISFSISSMFDDSVVYDGLINFSYKPVGAIAKTVHFILDNKEIDTQETSVSGNQLNYTLSPLTHGVHTFEVYFTAEVNAEQVESNHLYYELICVEEGKADVIITSNFKDKSASQYTLLNIPYQVYDPLNLTSEVKLYANDELISTQTVDRTVQTWAYRVDKLEDVKMSIVAGSVRRDFDLTVTDSGINVAVETENLVLDLSSAGRTNNEADPASWVSGDVAAQFENFNFVSDCWQLDSEGIPCLRVAGDARLTIPYKVFASDFRTTGKTIEIEFTVHDVMDYDSTVLSCLDGERGLKLTAQKATMKSEQSEVFTQYKEDSHVHLTFVVEKRSENRLMYIYINGIMSGAVQYPANDDFSQMIPQDIKIGSSDCAIDLYSIRVYDNNLNRQQVLNNWIASEQTVDAMLDKYNRNNIFDEYGQIVIDKLPTYLPYFVFETAELPQSKQDKGKTASGSFVNLMNPKLNFTYENAGVGVQGTSSAGYERKNYKVKFKGFTMSDNSVTAKYAMYDGAVPVATFTFKADVASSEGANNVELVRLYNDFAPKNPRQKANTQLRQGIDGFPMVVFWKNTATGETTFLGKYNFNNDKGTEEVYGFKEGDESWEILRNTSNLVLFKSADFESMTKDENGQDIPSWTLDFEGRYPDMNMDITNLKAMLEWVSSTDTSVVSDEAEKKARLQKFKDEFEQHFDLDTALYYYLFTELFLMVDSRAKNAFPTMFDGKWYWLPYDMDTAIGINNEGTLAFTYELEDIDLIGGTGVFNGQDSVLWTNLRQAFFPELAEMYRKMRSSGISYEEVEKRFEEHQSKWSEAIYNEDAWYKYLAPLVEKGNAMYLDMLLGSKAEQRKWWLYNRFRYMDSKYNAGDAKTDFITLRAYAKGDITITPYADVYASIKYGSYLVQHRTLRGSSYVLPFDSDNMLDTETYIYSAPQLKSVGDLSPLNVGVADFSAATHLQEIKVGDSARQNTKLTKLNVGNNKLLKKVDATNCTVLAESVDLSGASNIEEIYLEGSKVPSVVLPVGGVLRTLHLPGTVTNLTIRNQNKLTDFSIDSYSQITTLRLESNSEVIDSLAIVKQIAENSRVRIIGFTWKFDTTAEVDTLLAKLDTMRGQDENGANVDTAQLSGTIHVTNVTGAWIADVKARYPYLKFTYEHLTSQLFYYNYDGSQLLYTETILDGGNGAYTGQPSRSSTAQYTYSFAGWASTPNGSANSSSRNNVVADRSVYAAYSSTIRKYTVYFYNGSTLLQTVQNVPYGGSASYTGSTPTKTGVSDPQNYVFKGWNPSSSNIQGDTSCQVAYNYIGIEDTITDSWAEIIASGENGTYKDKYKLGDTKIIDTADGTVAMQLVAFDEDNLADGSGKAHMTWISEQLLNTSHRMNPSLIDAVAAIEFDPNASYKWIASADGTENKFESTNQGKGNTTSTGCWKVKSNTGGKLTINYTNSGEGDYDYLKFYVDGKVAKDCKSGGQDQTGSYELTLEANTEHIVFARFIKDGGKDCGEDKGTLTFICASDLSVEVLTEKYTLVGAKPATERTGAIGGWEKSEMREYIKSLKSSLPSEVQKAIKLVIKTHPAYTPQKTSFTQITQDDVWIPSNDEIFSTSSNPKYTVFFADANARKKKKNGSSSAYWWLRSANNSSYFHCVYSNGGGLSSNANISYGVAIGFCI